MPSQYEDLFWEMFYDLEDCKTHKDFILKRSKWKHEVQKLLQPQPQTVNKRSNINGNQQ